VVPGGIAAETRQTMENIKAALERCGSSLNHVVVDPSTVSLDQPPQNFIE
jgi:enamine deaminase RidA (YjgF/YER057c/UK114 family)